MSDHAYKSVIEYHQQTKHTLQKYANGPEALDWEAQPDPFRRFEGTQRIQLPLDAHALQYSYADVLKAVNPDTQSVTRQSLGSFFQISLGLSAWKQYGTDRWALRCNPSSGNLHPTEAYALLPTLDDKLSAGVYHYSSYDHCLEQRCTAPALADALTNGVFLLALSSIHWREAWKYGERSYRYCQLDVGHALAALRIAAAIHGWQVELISDYTDEQLASLIGLDRTKDFDNVEKEAPDLLLLVSPVDYVHAGYSTATLINDVQTDSAKWFGRANLLDPAPMYQWPVIEDVSQATKKMESVNKPVNRSLVKTAAGLRNIPEDNCVSLIMQRRSAQAFDPNHRIGIDALSNILASTLPHESPHLFTGIASNIHLLIFVHRVDGLDPGLYMQIRNNDGREKLQSLCRTEFDWLRPDNITEQLNLFHLVSANAQKVARSLACHQAIASESMFSVAMLANFEESVQSAAWHYRSLHWEAGVIGQMLYLAAEAHGLRGTGMGCFFDDAIHDLIGLKDTQYQCLYQFTVGVPVVDSRIVNLPPYEHLHN